MANIPSESLLSLNKDCILKIFSFLPITEQFKFAIVSNAFNDIIGYYLKSKTLRTSECSETFSYTNWSQIFLTFGGFVRSIIFDDWIDNANMDFHKLILLHCTNITDFNFIYPWNEISSIYTDVLSRNASSLEKITILEVFGDYHNMWREYDLLNCFVNITNLKSLHLIRFTDITGMNFHMLKNLSDLNIEHCCNFTPENFIELCKSSIQLVSLNIKDCPQFTEEVIDVLIETQLSLEDITIDNKIKGFQKLAKLKKLSRITIWEVKNGDLITELIDNLVKYHKNDLTKLKVEAHREIDTHHLHGNILKFENLVDLHLPHYKYLEDRYLVELTKNLPKLEKLGILMLGGSGVTAKGIFILSTRLARLRELELYGILGKDGQLVRRINAERQKMKMKQLTVT